MLGRRGGLCSKNMQKENSVLEDSWNSCEKYKYSVKCTKVMLFSLRGLRLN